MGHGNARIGRYGNRRSDARHDFKGQIVFPQEQPLFAAPAEYKGVAAFEAHDAFAFFGLIHQQLVDVFLFHGMVARCLAHIDVFGIFRRPAQDAVIGQTVIDNDVCHLEAIHCLHADKPVISGACTY